jgi:hypothetical protein
MDNKEILEKVLANQWWPFDRVDPAILEEAQRIHKKQEQKEWEDAPL